MEHEKEKIEIEIQGVHCIIYFLPKDNPDFKDDILRILSNNIQKR